MKTVAVKCRLKAGKQIVGAGCAETMRQFWMSRRAGRRRGERSSQLCRGRGGVPALYVPSWGGRSLPACRRRASIYYRAGRRPIVRQNKGISNKWVDVNSSQQRISQVVVILESVCTVQSTQLLFNGILHVTLLCIFKQGISRWSHALSKSRYSV